MKLPAITRVRIDINPTSDFIKKYSKRVKAIGGEYDRVTPGDGFRFVYLPNTVAGLALAAELLDKYPERATGTDIFLEHEPLETVPGDWAPFKNHFLNLKYYNVLVGAPAAGQLNAVILRWEGHAKLWWMSRPVLGAETRVAQDQAIVQSRLDSIVEDIRRALAAGVSGDMLKSALATVLP